MDHREAELHQEIIHTRQAIDHKLAQLEHWRGRRIHEARATALEVSDYEANAQWLQNTRGRTSAIMERYPWLIIAGGLLFGYCLSRRDAAQRRRRPSMVGSYQVVSGAASICAP
jgi:hypothetical protein